MTNMRDWGACGAGLCRRLPPITRCAETQIAPTDGMLIAQFLELINKLYQLLIELFETWLTLAGATGSPVALGAMTGNPCSTYRI
jgi:hypothetical protein